MKKRLIAIVLACITAVALVGLAACGGGANSAASGAAGAANTSGVEAKGAVDDYSWDELSKISQEIASSGNESAAIDIAKKYNLCTSDGQLDGTQVKNIMLADGTAVQVQIVGFVHDDKSDGSGKAGITFIFTDAIAEHAMNNSAANAGGWETSEMRGWLNSSAKGQLPQDLQAVIVPVNKMTNNAGKTSNASSATTTSDELWLFSARELCGQMNGTDNDNVAVLNAEGEEYKLFRDMDVTATDFNEILLKSYAGGSCVWWERSPDPSSSDIFLYASSVGNPVNYGYADYTYAVVPGFCI